MSSNKKNIENEAFKVFTLLKINLIEKFKLKIKLTETKKIKISFIQGQFSTRYGESFQLPNAVQILTIHPIGLEKFQLEEGIPDRV